MSDRRTSEQGRLAIFGVVGLALTAAGIGLPSYLGAPPGWVAASVGTVVLGALPTLIVKRWVGFLSRAGLFALIFVAVGFGNPWWWFTALLAWIGGLLLFSTLTSVLSADGPPRASVRLRWDDGEKVDNVDNPTQAQIMSRLDALDGATHTMVSLHNERGRFDVCCPEPRRYWAFHTEHHGNREHVSQLTSGLPDTGDEVAARVGGMDFHYPDHLWVSHADVIAAARAFSSNQPQPDTLTWNAERRGREIPIPPPLSRLA